MSRSYRHIYEKGKFKDILFKASHDPSDEGRFWEMVAYFNLGKSSIARDIASQYDDDFSSVSDPQLRQSFIQYAQLLMTMDHSPVKPLQRRVEAEEVIPSNLTEDITTMFGELFQDSASKGIVCGRVTSKHIDYGSYMCKYASGKEAIVKLRRQNDLLKALIDNLPIETPRPLSFEFNDSGDLAAFIYKKIPGKTISFKTEFNQQILDLILELQQLHHKSPIRQLLLPYRPELAEIAEMVTTENMEKNTRLSKSGIQAVRGFIRLCQDHLPIDPKRRTFIHGDLWYGNIITDGDSLEITGLIDFERGWYADPWIDFAKLSYDDGQLKALLQLYDQQVNSIDLDHTMAIVKLYRGLFILRRMRKERYVYLDNKIQSWIVQPFEGIKKLIE